MPLLTDQHYRGTQDCQTLSSKDNKTHIVLDNTMNSDDDDETINCIINRPKMLEMCKRSRSNQTLCARAGFVFNISPWLVTGRLAAAVLSY